MHLQAAFGHPTIVSSEATLTSPQNVLARKKSNEAVDGMGKILPSPSTRI
jgi:hypothetical protein